MIQAAGDKNVNSSADTTARQATGTATSQGQAARPVIFGALLLLCAVVFYYFAVLRIDYDKTALLDLRPYPDAAEYFAQAKALLEGGRPSIQIGYDKLPSRYPPGYPVLMLPWLKILPETKAILAPFRTNQTIGLALLLGVFAIYFYEKRPIAGGCAAVLLSTLPAYISFSRSSTSDISGATLALSSIVCVYFGLSRKQRWPIYLAAILLGAGFNVRTQLVFMLPLLLAMALLRREERIAVSLFHCGAVLLLFAIAASPIFFLNYAWFHDPFRMGYDFWIPGFSHVFSLEYVAKHARLLWEDVALQRQNFNVANVFGTGTHFVPAFIILAVTGLIVTKWNRFLLCALLAALSLICGTAMHGFAEGRYYLPILILLVAAAVSALEWASKMISGRRRQVLAWLIFAWFLFSCLGYPSQSGFPPKNGRSQAWDALHFTEMPRQSPAFLAATELVKTIGEQPAVVLSDLNPVYLNAVLPGALIAAPIDGKHGYRFTDLWHYDALTAKDIVARALANSVSVYALFISQKNMGTEAERLPKIEGYDWRPAGNSTHASILKLSPEQRTEPGAGPATASEQSALATRQVATGGNR